MNTKALTLLFCSLAAAPLWSMNKTPIIAEEYHADTTDLATLIDNYSINVSYASARGQAPTFAAQVNFAEKILAHKKEDLGSLSQKQFEVVSEALITLNGSIDVEINSYKSKLQSNPFKKTLWFFGGMTTFFGATLYIWRKPLFIPRVLGFFVSAGGFGISAGSYGIHTITENYARRYREEKIENLQTLQEKLNAWIVALSPFQTIS